MALSVTPTDEMKTLTVGNKIYEIVDDQAREDVSEVKADFSQLAVQISQVSMFEVGGISAAIGTELTVTNRLRTSKFSNTYQQITANDGYLFLVYAYDGNTYIGSWDGSTFRTSGTMYVNSFSDFSTNRDYDYRLAVKRTDDANIALSESENIIFEAFTDVTLSKPYKSADAKTTGDAIKKLSNEIVSASKDNAIVTLKLDDISTFTAGRAINGSGATVVEGKSYCTMYYIDVSDGMMVSAELSLITPTGFYQYVNFYDADKNFLVRIGGASANNVNGAVPANAKYCRITLSYVNTDGQPDNVTAFTFLAYYPLHFVENSPAKKWYVLGDSISAGYYSLLTADVPTGKSPAIAYADGTCSIWDNTLSHNYWGYMNKWFVGRELVGLAYPAQGYIHTASNSKNGINVVQDNSFADADLITVAWGFNDWHYNMVRGDHTLIDASEPIATTSTDVSQITTVNQAIWYCLGVLIEKAPMAKIIVQTPMNGWRYGGDFSTQWSIGYVMSQSGTLKDIHDDIIYWCDYYGLQYIDLTYNNSVVNLVNIKDALIDGSHPSDDAHKQLARSVWSKMGYC